jgi:hypothetical protein
MNGYRDQQADPESGFCTFTQTSLCRTGLPDYVIVAALMLLDRLKTKYPFAKGTSGKRLYFTTFMIASKLFSDGTFSGKNWRIIAQNEFSIPEINRMEREMCSHLEWQLVSTIRILSKVLLVIFGLKGLPDIELSFSCQHVSAAYIDDFLQKITASFEALPCSRP